MEWLSNIIVAVLAIFGSYVANMTISVKKNREDEKKDIERESRQDERMKVIEHKLDIHNGYAEKLNNIEMSIVSIQKDIDYIKKGQQ